MTQEIPNSAAIVNKLVEVVNEYGHASVSMSVSKGALIIKPMSSNKDLLEEIEALKLENLRLKATQCQCPGGGKG